MRIWIDGHEANVPQRLGSSQVAFELLKALEKIDRKNEYTILLTYPPMDDLPKERLGWKYKIIRPTRFKTWLSLPWALFTSSEKPDLIFSPTHYGPIFSPVKRMITIFDLAYLRFPASFKARDLWQMKLWTRISVQNASHIITISKSTRDDLVNYYKVDESDITIAYPGYDAKIFHPITDKKAVQNILYKYKIEGNFILFVGTIQPRKNLERLIEAFARLDNVKLVIVGKTAGLGRGGWMYEDILAKPKELGIEDKVIFTGFVPNEDLPYLMTGAKALILPSLWEGFGIPPLEAMACGTPVIVSNTSSLPEVVGSSGVKIDPYSVDQIEHAIRLLVFDMKFRIKKSKQSLKQASKFSWRKMARIVLKVFKEVSGIYIILV